MIQLLFIMLAAACYAVQQYLVFHNTKNGLFNKYYFFGAESWKRKYERSLSFSDYKTYGLVPAPDNFYYSFFNIEHKERFPWSATALVFLTSGYNLFQWLMIKFILLSLTVSYSYGFHFDWIMFFLLWFAWTAIFNLCFIGLKK